MLNITLNMEDLCLTAEWRYVAFGANGTLNVWDGHIFDRHTLTGHTIRLTAKQMAATMFLAFEGDNNSMPDVIAVCYEVAREAFKDIPNAFSPFP